MSDRRPPPAGLRLEPTGLPGLTLVRPDPRADDRGLFARTWCSQAFAAAGLPSAFAQTNLSRNRRAGTLRGLHFARPPTPEGKLVSCAHGAIFDVVVDLRRHSPTFRRVFTLEISAENLLALYIPPGFAHGFLTVRHDTDVHYQMTCAYQPGAAAGLRWDDPGLAIPWPRSTPAVISPADAALPAWDDALHALDLDHAAPRPDPA
jgi:dTDP-4-dehydrorhamnose 3,5-epimerase